MLLKYSNSLDLIKDINELIFNDEKNRYKDFILDLLDNTKKTIDQFIKKGIINFNGVSIEILENNKEQRKEIVEYINNTLMLNYISNPFNKKTDKIEIISKFKDHKTFKEKYRNYSISEKTISLFEVKWFKNKNLIFDEKKFQKAHNLFLSDKIDWKNPSNATNSFYAKINSLQIAADNGYKLSIQNLLEYYKEYESSTLVEDSFKFQLFFKNTKIPIKIKDVVLKDLELYIDEMIDDVMLKGKEFDKQKINFFKSIIDSVNINDYKYRQIVLNKKVIEFLNKHINVSNIDGKVNSILENAYYFHITIIDDLTNLNNIKSYYNLNFFSEQLLNNENNLFNILTEELTNNYPFYYPLFFGKNLSEQNGFTEEECILFKEFLSIQKYGKKRDEIIATAVKNFYLLDSFLKHNIEFEPFDILRPNLDLNKQSLQKLQSFNIKTQIFYFEAILERLDKELRKHFSYQELEQINGKKYDVINKEPIPELLENIKHYILNNNSMIDILNGYKEKLQNESTNQKKDDVELFMGEDEIKPFLSKVNDFFSNFINNIENSLVFKDTFRKKELELDLEKHSKINDSFSFPCLNI